MNPDEYPIMSEVEEYHWWYRGLRGVIAACLQSPRFCLPAAPRILDAGCGTGGNLKSLNELAQPSYLGGFDASATGLEYARRKVPNADLFVSDICAPVLHEQDLDLVISTDVIYTPGAEEALPGLQSIVKAMRPGGLFILNLPAYNWLFSEHDIMYHTKERYTVGSVKALLDALGLKIELLTYRVCFLFPALVAMRLPSIYRARYRECERSDILTGTTGLINDVLYRVMAAETPLLASGRSFPYGSSVFAIGRRP